jgi:hypothetical protein
MNTTSSVRPNCYVMTEVKQEGPYVGPHLWKDSLSMENITHEFLDQHATGEVINLDDFLKELRVNEMAETGGGGTVVVATAIKEEPARLYRTPPSGRS